MNCRNLRIKMLDYLTNKLKMDGEMHRHINDCAQCKECYESSSKALKDFLSRNDRPEDGKDADIFVNSIMPEINKKSIYLEERRKQKNENCIFAASLTIFLIFIFCIFYSYFKTSSTWGFYISGFYVILTSILALIIIPFNREEV